MPPKPQEISTTIFSDQIVDAARPHRRARRRRHAPQLVTTASSTIDSKALQNGGNDWIYGNVDRDILIGGAGNDAIDGGVENDLIFGDNVSLGRTLPRHDEPALPGALRHAALQPLRSAEPVPATGPERRQQRRAAHRRRRRRPYRDPTTTSRGGPSTTSRTSGTTSPPTNGDATGPAASATTTSPAARAATSSSASSATTRSRATARSTTSSPRQPDDATFGGIPARRSASARSVRRRRLHGHAEHRSATRPARSTTYPSVERATDGEDYIEGNGGNDVVFGGLGQDDIVGGSSDFFSLSRRRAARRRPTTSPTASDLRRRRPDADRRRERRHDYGGTLGRTIAAQRHARDADTIVGDNGDIVRIVGINDDRRPPAATRRRSTARRLQRPQRPARARYVTFNYDNYDASR